MGKKSAPPRGADVLYTRVVDVSDRHGLVRVDMASNDHTAGGSMPLSVAMELHHKLGVVIDKMLRRRVSAMERPAETH